MKRREVLGFSLIAGLTLVSCGDDDDDKKTTVTKIKDNNVTNNLEERIINKKDSTNPTDFELKHTPNIILGKVDDTQDFITVKVRVGDNEKVHSSVENHWIDEIELYADDKKVAISS